MTIVLPVEFAPISLVSLSPLGPVSNTAASNLAVHDD